MQRRSAVVSCDIWCIGDGLSRRTRSLLLANRTFESLVSEIAKKAKVLSIRRNGFSKDRRYFRAVATLRVPARLCTCFHSARYGYRAQYYQSTRNGHQSNRHAVTMIADKICSGLRPSRQLSAALIRSSLCGYTSKIWIHQGPWLRHPRREDFLLHVPRWIRAQAKTYPRARKLARWSRIVPTAETVLVVKGQYLRSDGALMKRDTKPQRSAELHNYGFT